MHDILAVADNGRPSGANLNLGDVAQAFPGAHARAAATELTLPADDAGSWRPGDLGTAPPIAAQMLRRLSPPRPGSRHLGRRLAGKTDPEGGKQKSHRAPPKAAW